jgi:uncharacterized protein (DUF3820 family)
VSDQRFIYYLETKLPFKKYKGETVRGVIDRDPEYIIWLHKKGVNDPSFGFRLAQMALDYLIEKNDAKGKKHLFG